MVQYHRQPDGTEARGRSGDPNDRLWPPVWLWLLVLAYVVTFSTLSIRKHNTYHSFTYDLGIISQVLWNTSHGRFFETSLGTYLDTELVGNQLGNHVYPILLVLAPVYRIWQDPRMLLVLQSLTLGLAAIPLYWIVRRKLKSVWLQRLLIVSYLLYPAIGFMNLFDFHTIALSVPLVFVAYWALIEERDRVFWFAVVLTLATREEMVIPVATLGIYCLFTKEWRRKGIALLLLASLWALVCLAIIVPAFNEGRQFRYLYLWSHIWGNQQSGDVGAFFAERGDLSSILSIDTLVYLAHLFLPLGFLSLLGPGLLAVSLPSLLYLLLGSRPNLHRVGFQYPAILLPWFFLAAIQGLAWLERRAKAHRKTRLPQISLLVLLTGTLLGSLIFSPVLFYWRNGSFGSLPYQDQIENTLKQIPPEAGVATSNAFGAHMAHRRRLLGIEWYDSPMPEEHLQHVDYVLLDVVDCRVEQSSNPRQAHADMILDLLGTRQFGVRYWSGRILLLERGLPLGPEVEEVEAAVNGLVEEQRPCWP